MTKIMSESDSNAFASKNKFGPLLHNIAQLNYRIATQEMNQREGYSILTVIDFSESSKEVLKWATCMAEKLSVHLTILHPYRLNQLDKKEDMVGVKKKIEFEAVQNFESVAHDLFSNQNVSFDFRAEVGFIQDRMEDYARRNNILFFVIGFNLLEGNEGILKEIESEIKIPLMVVPQPKSNLINQSSVTRGSCGM